jgi:hypothetical protein
LQILAMLDLLDRGTHPTPSGKKMRLFLIWHRWWTKIPHPIHMTQSPPNPLKRTPFLLFRPNASTHSKP